MSTTQWPDTVGKTWKEAERRIRNEYPNISIQVIRKDSSLSKEFKADRVRIVADENGNVIQTPRIG